MNLKPASGLVILSFILVNYLRYLIPEQLMKLNTFCTVSYHTAYIIQIIHKTYRVQKN